MGRALSEAFPTARRTFEEANDVLGYDLARLCFEGPAEDLTVTHVCQPAILTNSVAAWRVAKENGVTGDLAMGHSLGEYSALVACGSLGFEEALRLVQARGDATTDVSAAHPGQMVALMGASDEDVEALCAEAGEVWPANYNSPGQVVASGLHRGVDRLLDLARARGIKARLLDVDGAFHSSVMAPATEKLREALSNVKISAPSLPFLSADVGALRARRAPALAAGPAAHGAGALHPDRAHGPRPRRGRLRRVRPPARAGGPRAAHPPGRQRGQPRRPGGPARPPGDGRARGVGRFCRCRSR